MLTSFIGILYPYVFSKLIDEVFYHQNMSFFLSIVICYGVIFVVEQSLHLILSMTWTYLSNRFLFDIRKKMHDNLLLLKGSKREQYKTGDLLTRFSRDTDTILKFIHSHLFGSVADIIRIVFSVVFVFFLNKQMAVLMVVVTPISLMISKYIANKVKTYSKNERDESGRFSTLLLEAITGIREIRILNAESQFLKKLVSSIAFITRQKNKANVIELGSERSNTAINQLTTIMIYVTSALFVMKGEMTVGAFVAVIDYFVTFSKRLSAINQTIYKIEQSKPSISKIIELVNIETSDKEMRKSLRQYELQEFRDLTFKNVHLQYHGQFVALSNINVQIRKGEKIAIVGRSGSGKSSFVKLLGKIYEPNQGSIYYNDQDIASVPVNYLRKNIGLVQQEPFFFDETIRYNLMVANSNCSEEEIWNACEQAQIADFIKSLPHGLDTKLSDKAANISGGQKQRLSIARILLRNPAIIILDESTSGLDKITESKLLSSLDRMRNSKTIIIIAHTFSTIRDVDRILVFDEGKMVSEGTHETLIHSCPIYQKLFAESVKEESA